MAKQALNCERVFQAKLSEAEFVATRVAKNRFCPKCREAFGNRLRALQLQAEHGKTIWEVIEGAGLSAGTFESIRGGLSSRLCKGDVVRRFHEGLGIRRLTLHDWLRFFFQGAIWPDWKRRFICRGQSCSIVDVSRVKNAGPVLSKYQPVVKFRQHGICACPIKGARVILVNLTPEGLEPKVLSESVKAGWVPQLRVRSGPHLPLLDRQVDC